MATAAIAATRSVIDWTPVAAAAIAAASGIGGAALGYFTARYQSKGELERVRLKHGEEHLRHRQAVYHDFLDSAHRFHQASGMVEPFKTPEEYQRWAREFEHRLTAVRLFGTAEASHAAQRLADVIFDAMSEPDQYDEKHEPQFLATWEETVEAMRPDTAPGG